VTSFLLLKSKWNCEFFTAALDRTLHISVAVQLR